MHTSSVSQQDGKDTTRQAFERYRTSNNSNLNNKYVAMLRQYEKWKQIVEIRPDFGNHSEIDEFEGELERIRNECKNQIYNESSLLVDLTNKWSRAGRHNQTFNLTQICVDFPQFSSQIAYCRNTTKVGKEASNRSEI